tara:strand:+ start:1297 stop:1806 length:510 start_codon:yes stop_codon:yes gene_type:complete
MNFLTNLKARKNSFFKKENIYYFILVIIIFIFDRFSKSKIISNFNENSYYVNNFINLDLIWNIGIGFGFLSTDSSVSYSLVTTLIGIVIIFLLFIFTISEKTDKLIYSLIIGGALGNFYDRLVYKAVPDFIDIHYNNFHWFTFNVADIFITIGVIIFVIYSFFDKNLNK